MSLFGKFFRGAATAASVVIGMNSATAQEPNSLPPAISNIPGLTAENPIEPASGFGRSRGAPCQPYFPCPPTPTLPGTTPPTEPPQPPMPPMPPTTSEPSQPQFDFGDLGGGADVGPLVPQNGYIETAMPVTMARVRFDSAYNSNRPDRGEFFYAKALIAGGANARGPGAAERSIDYQELITTGEVAFTKRFSAFFNLPVRFLNPDVNLNASGIGDVSFGGKYAFIYNPRRIATLFLQFQAPSGSLSNGLGNGNWWIEPGLLYLEQINRKWQVFGEFRFLTPLGTRSDFTGNLLRYGFGSSYIALQGQWGYVAPVAEVVGWTVLSGKETDLSTLQVVGAAGDTIVNAKFGLRIGFGSPKPCSSYLSRGDMYIGYGRALTGEVWYKDMLRFEVRRFF